VALMNLKVVPAEGEPFTARVTPKVIVAAERHFGKGMAQLFGDAVTFEALAWVAWTGARLAGRAGDDFDAWLDTIDAIEAVEDAAAPLGGAV
jgi:hypothetical protein